MLVRWSRRSLVAGFALLAACAGDEINTPTDPVEGTLTVDASSGWTFLSLADEAVGPRVNPRSSPDWDIGFNATNVMLNGGAAGPAGVTGYCVCGNAAASNAEVLAMTAESELADFDAVTLDDVPASGFVADELLPALATWYQGTGAAATADDRTWLLRLRNGTSFAKLHVTSLENASADAAGQVTVEYAVQPTAADPFGPVQEVVLDAAAGATLDLIGGVVDGAEWDLAIDGFTIRLNGGVSGTGSAAAAATDESFEAVTTASTDPRAYVADRFGGVFADHPWYRYNLTGEHGIHPTFDVYLVKRGGEVYKLQILDYYDPAGEPRHITVRYARLTE